MTIAKTMPFESICNDRSLAIRALAEELRRGSLALALGAGVSNGMGLPRWTELVIECLNQTGISGVTLSPTPSSDELLTAINRVEGHFADYQQYLNLVRDKLYVNCKQDLQLLDQKLLSTIGAMTMKSRRGFVSEVLTVNFDDVLERYLDLHGFACQTIARLPQVRVDTDVTVYHVHGFLASPGSKRIDSDRILFSGLSFDLFAGAEVEPFRTQLRDLLLRKMLLFVGMSPGQRTINELLMGVKSDCQSTRGVSGFWLLGPKDPANSEAELRARNVVPIRLPTYEEWVTTLLEICRQAAGTV